MKKRFSTMTVEVWRYNKLDQVFTPENPVQDANCRMWVETYKHIGGITVWF